MSSRYLKPFVVALGAVAMIASVAISSTRADDLHEIRLDWATYNPVSIVLKDQGLLEKAFAADGVAVRWVQSRGSNKALEFLNAGSIDFGSTAGAAALVARVNGNPIKAIYVYSAPEWTALVTRKGSGITKVSDLKGKRVAVTRGTDPHIFLIRALADAGLAESDVQTVLLQHADGRAALDRGDVDAWAGLDPMMAAAEIDNGDVLFFRDKSANTYGVLDVREGFAKEHPDAVRKVLSAYEQARLWSVAHPDAFKALIVKATGASPAVIDRQIDQRTDISKNAIGEAQRQSILAAGLALRKVGILPAATDVKGALDALIDGQFHSASTQ
jgi:sulfonate transport system substrate-binding protein